MAINFIPSDPASQDAVGRTMISIAPSADRPAGANDFDVAGLPEEAEYADDTPSFIAWQAREAAIRALNAFERVYGPIPGWTGDSRNRTLPLIPNAGTDLNAYYNRRSVSFFQYMVTGRTVYSGKGMKVVAHETGHAILDAIRPDLFGVNMVEVGAFHEGFGDCIAIHTALADASLRTALLAGGNNLRRVNFVETMGEEMSDAIRVVAGPKHNAAAPRHGHNSFQWAFPTSLPIDGPPGVLINEEHSLGQIVSGVFYDLICSLFEAGPQSDAGLAAAADRAMLLTAKGVLQAPIKPRFLESWGRSMAVLDRNTYGGASQEAIKAAFARHGIAVGASNFLAPKMRLSARSARVDPTSLVTASNKRLVREVLGLDAATPLVTRALHFGEQPVAEVVGKRDVDLSGIDPRLDDVHSTVPQPAIVGGVDGSTALLGAVDSGFTYDAEVRAFAETLLARDAIAFGSASKAGAGFVPGLGVPTHRIATDRGRRILKRVAYTCGCKRHRARAI